MAVRQITEESECGQLLLDISGTVGFLLGEPVSKTELREKLRRIRKDATEITKRIPEGDPFLYSQSNWEDTRRRLFGWQE